MVTNQEEIHAIQLAGISTAATGYWKEGDSIDPDYDTVALRDVAKLYAKYDQLYQAIHLPANDQARTIIRLEASCDALTKQLAQAVRELKAVRDYHAVPEGWKLIAVNDKYDQVMDALYHAYENYDLLYISEQLHKLWEQKRTSPIPYPMVKANANSK